MKKKKKFILQSAERFGAVFQLMLIGQWKQKFIKMQKKIFEIC
jgi:hypothetical protein